MIASFSMLVPLVSGIPCNHQETPSYQLLSQHFAIQQTDASCSAASVAMVVNALLDYRGCTTFFSEKDILDIANIPEWNIGAAQGGDGISLNQIGRYLEVTLDTLEQPYTSVQTVHMYPNQSKQSFKQQLEQLNTPELTSFIIANFEHSRLVPSELEVGHFSPIGAYDPQTDKVLIMDVSRDLNEIEGWANGPYWVKFDDLWDAMNTIDTGAGQSRGYIRLTL